MLPYYGCIRKANLPACDTGISVPVTISGRTETARIWESAMDDGTPVAAEVVEVVIDPWHPDKPGLAVDAWRAEP